MADYHALARWCPERIGALALYCSDGRWGDAFDEFCHQHLQIPRYDRWAVPGGPAWVAMPEQAAEARRAIRTQLDFLVEAHELERVVLITHYGCAWYGRRLRRSPDECLSAQLADVEAASATLQSWHPGLRVEAYLAMRQQQSVTFHRLDIVESSGRRLPPRSLRDFTPRIEVP
jgi:hypothetical protein